MSNSKTTQTAAGKQGAHDDVESDPAAGVDDGADWSDEGGATPEGPATG